MMSNSIEKHAYIILYHKNSDQLIRLLKILDDPRNDIYIHADKRSRDFPMDQLRNAVKKSGLFFTERISVHWGSFSIVKATLILLKEATKKGQYAYYHLLSGQDLPIKTQDYIHTYFKENSGKEFINFLPDKCRETFVSRIKQYRFLQELYGGRKGLIASGIQLIERASVKIQRSMKINRIRGKEKNIFFGSEWFSVTNEFAKYTIQHEKWINRTFSWTSIPDELFMQTLIMNSPFKLDIHDSMRYISWGRTVTYHPLPIKKEDFNMIASSDCLFARKFDQNVDNEIIELVIEHLCLKKQTVEQ